MSQSPSKPPAHCTFAAIGGGWAGTYAAWRVAIDEKIIPAKETCLFEASPRWGGRTYTVRGSVLDDARLQGLNIDIGAYRFAHEQHLPSDLLTKRLNLTSGCYMPSCSREPLDDNLTLYKLLEPDGSTASGYGTALDVMRAQLVAAGATLMRNTTLVAMHAHEHLRGSIHLLWAEDAPPSVAMYVLLNLPRHALLALERSSLLFSAASQQTLQLYNCSRAKYDANYTQEASVKVYAVYRDAWWGTKLGLWEGEVQDTADPPVYIRYHDGPLRCDGGVRPRNGTRGVRCRGALLAQYAHTNEQGAAFYLPYQRAPHEALTVLDGSNTTLGLRLHAKLLAVHAKQLHAAGIDPTQLEPPTALVLGYWRHAVDETRHPAPEPLSFTTSPGKVLPACVRHLTSQAYSAATRSPLPQWPNVMVANNDWWLEESSLDLIAPYWAEVSLRSAERALHDSVPGVGRPPWLDDKYYERSVLQI